MDHDLNSMSWFFIGYWIFLTGRISIRPSFFVSEYLLFIMTTYDFNGLDVWAQADSLYKHGVFLSDRQSDLYLILLYQIHGFYVEVYFHKGKSKIVRFRSFSNSDRLLPYLEKIDIGALLKPQ